MDSHGYFSISLGTDYTMAAIAKARAVVLEVNPNVPFACGNCHVHVSQVAALVESEEPILEVGLPKIGPVQEAIGHHVAAMIDDGSTLQIGYGGIPDAVVMQLTHKHDLGIHTEMLGDGILSLIERGVVTNRRKTWMPGKSIATFAPGSARSASPAWIAILALEMHPVNFTNDPCLASQQRQPDRDQCDAADRPARPMRLGERSATRPIPAPAANRTSSARPTVLAAARRSSSCRRRRRTTRSRASCRPWRRERT